MDPQVSVGSFFAQAIVVRRSCLCLPSVRAAVVVGAPVIAKQVK